MHKINKFFLTGTLGVLATAVLHILMNQFAPQNSVPSAFDALYLVFLGFLMLGTGIMIKRKGFE